MKSLPFRQIHLDFHTSELVPNVGEEWDAGHFQQMLKLGHVSSMTVFSKCHHGWSYHPTSVPLSQMHPKLKFDLLGEMIEAAHEIGVKVPVYLSAGLDEKLARTHSQWIRRTPPDGGTTWAPWMEAGYHEFCMRSPYLDYLVEQVEEVTRNYDADGIFLDIVGARECVCQYCFNEMIARGQDPRDPEAQKALGRETYFNYAKRINDAIHAIKPEMRIFHNGGHITRGDRDAAFLNTHLELESLPTGGWGYDHFPLSARYVQGLGMDFLGMTGKFHTTWGEFGGFKHPNALRYEAALSIANGARISVGDQMHPFGKLEPATYSLIGKAFSEVEAKEPWCRGAVSVADIGVLSVESIRGREIINGPAARTGFIDAGVVRVLQEGGLLYDVIDTQSDFTKYPVLVLPDDITLNESLRAKLDTYLQAGGKIFATGSSGMDAGRSEFLLDFGARYLGESAYSPEYIMPEFELENWEKAAFVVYSPMKELEIIAGTVLANRLDPFFNRDLLHFSSHYHTPNNREAAGPCMVATESTVYLAFPAFQLYADKGQNVLRDIILHGINSLLGKPTLVTSLPAQGIQTVMRQQAEGRTVVHLLYASPVKRGSVEVIEDIVPINDVKVALRVPFAPRRVYLAPQGVELPFTVKSGELNTTAPVVECHQMVVVE